ncbi:hypothetical protein F4553_006742 [Allocatelliglobosispora scoriae]|uniref:DUF2278 family protein n=1 Tax=Allocatelliglobosispora scoriae TaxID=643052 RepID=A0A841C0P1_9ACTN|nr:DUF2278 family protein [Allocatelliglobosispora scoriae]MBB5873308.1 hypothetical protein [Allocatelliglobosispora scoriae]
MPLPRYGVAIGTFHSFFRDPSHEFGEWYHGHIELSTPAGIYEAALDVDAPSSVGVSYRLVDDLTVVDIATIRALPDGFHQLASTPTSGALDYVRSPLLQNRLLWELLGRVTTKAYQLAMRPPPGAPVFGPDASDSVAEALASLRERLGHMIPGPRLPHLRIRHFPWVSSAGDNALDVIEPLLRSAARIYVFGQGFQTGRGVHDVHLNQGDPAGSQWYPTNGIWQDGAVMAEQPDGRVAIWQIKFNTQSLLTDDAGHPR